MQNTTNQKTYHFKTTEDRVVLVNVRNPNSQTKGGIFIPDNADRNKIGDVVAVGNSSKDAKVGQTVLIEKGAGIEITVNEEKVTIIRNSDIIFIL